MVPNGWVEGRVADLLNGLESGVSVNGENRDLLENEKAVLKVSAVSYGKFDPLSAKVIEGSELIRAKTNPKRGQIIISRSNTEDLVGASAYIESDYPNLFLPDKLWQTIPKKHADMRWLSYVLASDHARYTLSKLATGTSGSMKNITQGELLSLKILVPSACEQKKIAQVLSTWDRAITTSEQLLANSQQQKKALMQQLLTGKKRLLDKNGVRFSGEWKDLPLNEMAEVIVSPVDKKTVPNEIPVELCNYTDVYYNHQITRNITFMKATATKSEIAKYTLRQGDVIITKDSETPGDIAVSAIVSEDLNGVVCGYHLAIVRPKLDSLNGAFLNYLFSMQSTRYYFFTLATGATRFGLSVGGINRAHFRVPDVAEQQKIAAVLSTTDQEITLLQQKLKALKQEKKALMQQLLTGKRRVKINEKEVA